MCTSCGGKRSDERPAILCPRGLINGTLINVSPAGARHQSPYESLPQTVFPHVNESGGYEAPQLSPRPPSSTSFSPQPTRDYQLEAQEEASVILNQVAGWGWTEHNFGPDALQKVTLDVITLSSCRDTWTADNITSAKMCTLTTDKDTCNGDSGGSIFWTAPDNGLLYSIAHVDLGLQFCAREMPAINTRIAPNLEWILENSPESDFCIV
uniref:Uncharacterized protein n=1 Tax=Phlebotomus papatasi TaxID=29031 RepID=A0A1B0GM84_PHLPP